MSCHWFDPLPLPVSQCVITPVPGSVLHVIIWPVDEVEGAVHAVVARTRQRNPNRCMCKTSKVQLAKANDVPRARRAVSATCNAIVQRSNAAAVRARSRFAQE